ncbi:MAG: pyridoxamine 5'-phosphate oxidase family protein [Candidatus Sungbacteria bacterium]|nr:pyridoxamine 5'-phosphate oxidase family protein [Candidatus Sungbacteria bacterium]
MPPEKRAQDFMAYRKTLVLGTVGADGTPTASYAPFVQQNNFYIYTSALSRHTSDLQEIPKASILFIEDEAGVSNLFARKRITFSCDVEVIPRWCDEWVSVMEHFGEKFGSIFDAIRPLGDFVLFCLKPYEAVYVEGFGQAYRLNADLTNAVHVKGTGPGAKEHT